MTIRATIKTTTPKATALLFQGILGADRGVTSTLHPDGAAFIVLADDGQAVRFEPIR